MSVRHIPLETKEVFVSYVSDAHRFRKTIAGVCMLLAPVAFLIGSVIGPGVDSNEATQVGLIAGDTDSFILAVMLQMVGWACFLVAVMGMMHMLRERGASEGHLGGALALAGTVCALAQTGFLVALWQVAKSDEAAATSLLSGLDGIASVVLFFLPLGVTVGGIVLSWSLYRHHFIAPWMAAAIGGSAILFAAGSVAYSQDLYIAASAVLLVGFGAMGAMVLSEPVEEWEHTPEFHGIGLSH
jgi:hypothetical protein